MTTSDHDPARSARPELDPRDAPDALRPDLARGPEPDGEATETDTDVGEQHPETPRPRPTGSP